MSDFEVLIDMKERQHLVGLLRCNATRGSESILFEYHERWLDHPVSFPLEPGLPLQSGIFAPPAGQSIFGSIGDSSPDSWGRRLLQRAEHHQATRQGLAARTLSGTDFLMAVADDARLGALRFRPVTEKEFLSPSGGYAPIKELRNLLEIANRFFSAEETEDDLQSLLPVATCLGGARPKVSVRDQDGHPVIAKFPKETDDYCIETWEAIALRLADQAGIPTAPHRLIEVSGKRVLLTQRFDRVREQRIPFLSAMAMLGRQDGESASYPEIAEILFLQGSQGKAEAQALYRRMTFNVLISNVDDHLRNHGFLWSEDRGWHLSPAYDLNPVPSDIKARVLSTHIDLDDGTCSLDLLEAASGYFELSLQQARSIIRDVATVTANWRNVAKAAGARGSEINRMASAVEHTELRRALRL